MTTHTDAPRIGDRRYAAEWCYDASDENPDKWKYEIRPMPADATMEDAARLVVENSVFGEGRVIEQEYQVDGGLCAWEDEEWHNANIVLADTESEA